jgi:hypothetical protein
MENVPGSIFFGPNATVPSVPRDPNQSSIFWEARAVTLRKALIEQLGIPCLVVLLATAAPTARAAPFTFFDNFSPSASPDWSNTTGHWSASSGDYAAQIPNNAPQAVTFLPFDLTNTNLQVTVTVNALGDGGIIFNSGNVELVLGGSGYGQGARGGNAGNSAYWGNLSGGEMDLVTHVFTPGDTYTITVTVNGDTYTAYDDPDGSFDSSSTVLTTLIDSAFTSGEVGLYDDQPNKTTGSGSGTPTSFSNFSLQGTLVTRPVPEPASLLLFGTSLAWLGAARRRRR